MPYTPRLSALLPQQASILALPQLNYSIARPYQWKWFPYVVYGFMLLVLAILVPVTYASQGYQIVTAYKEDPNTISVHWYHAFIGNPTPGSQCDEHLFNLGDTFRTSIGVLPYTIQSIQYNSSDGLNVFGGTGTTIPYKGLDTDSCDIISVDFQMGLQESAVGKVSIQCIHKDFQVGATTTVDMSDVISSGLSNPFGSPLMYVNSAAADLIMQPFQMPGQNVSGTVGSSQITISAQDELVTFCPMSMVKNETDVYGEIYSFMNMTQSPTLCTPQNYSQPAIDPRDVQARGQGFYIDNADNAFAYNAIVNYMQVLASVVRYDLGSQLPSNFLVNPSAVLSQNQTFLPLAPDGAIPAELDPFGWENVTVFIQNGMSVEAGYLPLVPVFNASAPNQTAPPTLSTTYACHLVVRKPAGAAVVSVIVATLSIGTSIWGVLMLTAAFFARRDRPEANCCEYHVIEDGLPKSLNASEEHLELQDSAVDEFEMTTKGFDAGASTPTRVAP